jgi:dCMP deaminase
MEISERWQGVYGKLALTIAGASKDPSTKVGAVIYRTDKSIASMGFNGLPSGMPDDPAILENREEKIKHMKHAEHNALDFISLDEDMYNYGIVTTFLPCIDCATRIMRAGIKTVYYMKASREAELRWADSFAKTHQLFKAAGIKAYEIDSSVLT